MNLIAASVPATLPSDLRSLECLAPGSAYVFTGHDAATFDRLAQAVSRLDAHSLREAEAELGISIESKVSNAETPTAAGAAYGAHFRFAEATWLVHPPDARGRVYRVPFPGHHVDVSQFGLAGDPGAPGDGALVLVRPGRPTALENVAREIVEENDLVVSEDPNALTPVIAAATARTTTYIVTATPTARRFAPRAARWIAREVTRPVQEYVGDLLRNAERDTDHAQQERVHEDRADREQQMRERREQDRAAQEEREAERRDQARREAEQREGARREQQRRDQERRERERQNQEQRDQERRERQRQERDANEYARLHQEQQERDRRQRQEEEQRQRQERDANEYARLHQEQQERNQREQQERQRQQDARQEQNVLPIPLPRIPGGFFRSPDAKAALGRIGREPTVDELISARIEFLDRWRSRASERRS